MESVLNKCKKISGLRCIFAYEVPPGVLSWNVISKWHLTLQRCAVYATNQAKVCTKTTLLYWCTLLDSNLILNLSTIFILSTGKNYNLISYEKAYY